MLRVQFLHAGEDPWGAEESLFILAREMLEAGHEPSLVCRSASVAAVWRDRVGAPVLVITERSFPRATPRVNKLGSFLPALRRLPPADHVVIFSYELLMLIPAMRAAHPSRSFGIWWDCHDLLAGSRAPLLMRALGRSLTGVISVSDYVGSQVSSAPRWVLHRPVDRTVPPSAGEPGVRTVGVVGRLEPDKRVDLIVRAVSAMRNPVTLVVRGGIGTSGEAYGNSVLAFGTETLGSRFRYEGRSPSHLVLRGLDVLICANAREPLGRTVLEGQVAGIPVVVPDQGGASELVEDGRTGLTFRSEDDASLAAVLDRLVDDPDLAGALGSAGRSAALSRPDPAGYARSYAAILAGGVPRRLLEGSWRRLLRRS